MSVKTHKHRGNYEDISHPQLFFHCQLLHNSKRFTLSVTMAVPYEYLKHLFVPLIEIITSTFELCVATQEVTSADVHSVWTLHHSVTPLRTAGLMSCDIPHWLASVLSRGSVPFLECLGSEGIELLRGSARPRIVLRKSVLYTLTHFEEILKEYHAVRCLQSF
jgi:hypothetical protein